MTPIAGTKLPAIPPSETIDQRFERLAGEWEKAVAHHSSTTLRNNHPAYREIISLGPAVVPILLRDLETTHRHWFAALHELTGVDPIPDSAAGNIPEMVEAWLAWAREHGYAPNETVAERFKRLAEQWETDVAYLSSMGYDHPVYRKIIAIGPEVVPLLLRDMELHHTHWFCALREITGVNPVPKDAAGHIAEMVQFWLKWARQKGYQW